jgi:hypothetical protein
MAFTDMMTSARGPGVIGMLIALLVLLGFGTLFIFAFDEGAQGGDLSIEAMISRQAREIDSLKFRIEQGEKQLAGAEALHKAASQLAEFKRENKFRGIELNTLQDRAAAADETLNASIAEFESYKDKYRAFVRNKAKGEKLETLATTSGKTYRNVEIRQVTPVGMQIRHDDGQLRIPYEELPADMQDYYQFDPKQKTEAIAQEIETRKKHEAAVATAQASTAEAKEQQRAEEAEQSQRDAAAAINRIDARLASLRSEVNQLQGNLAAESRKSGVRNSAQIQAQISAKKREMNELRSKLSSLRNQL